MTRIFALTLTLALSACAASTPALQSDEAGAPAAPSVQAAAPTGDATDAAAEGAEGTERGGGDETAAPCAGKTGRDLVDCKKSQKAVKTKFLFKSGGGMGGPAADVGDDDDDD